MLADLFNVPATRPELDRWSFSHQDQHSKITQAIYTQFSTNLPEFILDPIPDPGSPAYTNWLENNQASHTAFDGILGIAGNDLTDLDYSKPDQVQTWIRLHAEEHRQALQILKFPD